MTDVQAITHIIPSGNLKIKSTEKIIIIYFASIFISEMSYKTCIFNANWSISTHPSIANQQIRSSEYTYTYEYKYTYIYNK